MEQRRRESRGDRYSRGPGAVTAPTSSGTPEALDRAQDGIIAEMSVLEDWLATYEYLVRLGQALTVDDDGLRSDEHSVSGCQSRVWIRTELRGGRVRIFAALPGRDRRLGALLPRSHRIEQAPLAGSRERPTCHRPADPGVGRGVSPRRLTPAPWGGPSPTHHPAPDSRAAGRFPRLEVPHTGFRVSRIHGMSSETVGCTRTDFRYSEQGRPLYM